MKKGSRHTQASKALIGAAKVSEDATRPYRSGGFLHRTVAETLLGRPLAIDEVVHHKDGDTRNNGPSNLQVLTRGQHSRLHMAGESNPNFGVARPVEVRRKISAAVRDGYQNGRVHPRKGVALTTEQRENLSAVLTGRAPTPGTAGKKMSDETRARMRAAQIARRTREKGDKP